MELREALTLIHIINRCSSIAVDEGDDHEGDDEDELKVDDYLRHRGEEKCRRFLYITCCK